MSDDRLLWGAFRAARVGAWAWDIERDQITWSDGVEDLFGLEPGTFDGTYEAYLALLDDESSSRLRAAVGRCLAGEAGEYLLEHPIRWPDGSERWLECRGAVVFEGSAPKRMFGTVADVTERRAKANEAEQARQALEAQLVHAQKLDSLGRLAGGVAHDFNNLLTAILSYAELAQRRTGRDCPIAPELTEISRTVQRAADLTGQLLAFARKQAASPRSVNANRLVESVADLLRRTVGVRVEIVLRLDAEPLNIRVDPGQLEQTLVNLAVNARDAMPDGGSLTISSERLVDTPERARVVIRVTDTGTGMNAETLERVFEPFFTTKGPGRGTGLGLATCHGLVRQNGGDIRIASEIGRGTTVDLIFPEDDAIERAPCEVVATPDLRRGSETVLLVEERSISCSRT
jgi:two-component system cell cycle sensor histidine kinase/response regulator CckA